MRTHRIALPLLILLASATAFADEAQLRALLRASDLRAESLHVAPDGRSVIAVVRTAIAPYRDDFVGLGARALFLIDLRARSMRALTEGAEDARAPAWSPDSTRIAFFTRAFQLVTLDLSTGARTVIGSIEGNARNPVGTDAEVVWSDGGQSVAYTVQPEVPWNERFIDRATVAPATLDGPIVVDGASADAPLLRAQGMRGAFFAETPKELRIGSRVIGRLSEDERLLAFSGDEVLVCHGSAIESLPSRRRVANVDGHIVHARRTGPSSWLLVSRKGAESIAWSLRGDAVQQLGRTMAAGVTGVTSNTFIVIEERGTTDRLLAIDFRSGASRTLLDDAVVRRAVVVNDQVLVVAATATEPESLQLITLRARIRIGHWPGVDGAAFGGITTRVIRWQSENATIEGLLVTPASQKPSVTLLFLHGGPESRATADTHGLHGPLGGYAAIFARAGYTVLLPNFRNGKDLGNGRLFQTPAADTLAGIQKLIDDGIADPKRLGIYGFSYGAMLTAWIVARDHRFRAAAVSAGTLDMLSDDRTRLRGNRAYHAYARDRAGPEDQLLDHWNAPEKYRELSPLERARDVRTPVLLISTAAEQLAGRDYPAYFNALRVNQVPVQWAYYPAAWHGGSWSIDDRADSIERQLQWFGRFIQ